MQRMLNTLMTCPEVNHNFGIPVIKFDTDASPVNYTLERSLELSQTRIMMKILKANSKEILTDSQSYFGL